MQVAQVLLGGGLVALVLYKRLLQVVMVGSGAARAVTVARRGARWRLEILLLRQLLVSKHFSLRFLLGAQEVILLHRELLF